MWPAADSLPIRIESTGQRICRACARIFKVQNSFDFAEIVLVSAGQPSAFAWRLGERLGERLSKRLSKRLAEMTRPAGLT